MDKEQGAIWERNLQILNNGGYGIPTEEETLLRYWTEQDKAGYPGASENVRYFTELILEKEKKILNSLRICSNASFEISKGCEGCEYKERSEESSCVDRMLTDSIHHMQWQRGEIERLRAELEKREERP